MRNVFSGKSIESGAALERCRLLFLLTILLLFLEQVLEGTLGEIIIGALFIGVIGQGVFALSDDARHRKIGSTLGVLASVAMVVSVLFSGLPRPILIVIALFFLFFFAYATWRLLSFVILTGADSRTKLSAALSAYLFAGLTWAMAYAVVQFMDADAFSGAPIDAMKAAAEASPAAGVGINLKVFSYFSFVTLTTLGYGEIVPVAPLARVLVMLEAVGGVLYVGVMVASLVGRVQWEAPPRGSGPGDQPPS